MSESLPQLKARIAQITRIGQAASLLGWDQQTYMPTGGANARAEQMAALSQMTHEMFVSDATGNLLAQAEADTQGQDGDSDDVRMLQNLRREFDRATKLPTELVTEIARHETLAQEIWMKARAASDYAAFRPALEKMFDLMRQKAECFGYRNHIYDALLDTFELGAKQAEIAAMFADMKPGLVALTRAIAASSHPVSDALLYGDFPIPAQRAFTWQTVQAIGFDATRGRQDEAAHPFCSGSSRDDVRITTRYSDKFLQQGLYASLHEAGHAMYEQGSPEAYEATPLSGGVSLGVHESQSRLWENLVGRSRPFSRYIFPLLQKAFPGPLEAANAEDFYRAINKVAPSLIRVEADEVTYNLHILMRFELECDLLTGTLSFDDLPDAWNSKMQEYFGITPPDAAQGCLQDIHWSCALIGYFPTYSLGNLISAQLFHAIRKTLPDLDAQIERGEFAPILGWLRENIHQYGSKFQPAELIERATGEKMTARYYTEYITGKYSDIYALK